MSGADATGGGARSAGGQATSVARNSLWNLLGQLVPMAAAVLGIPFLVRGLGIERFGILTLVWVLIGYFGLFDLGVGSSLTKLVAERNAPGEEADAARLVRTALVLLLGLGVVGAGAIAGLAPWLARSVLRVAPRLQAETAGALRVLAAGIPAVFLSVGIKGVLEARGHFRLSNTVRIPMGVFNIIGPLVCAQVTPSLVAVVAVLVAGRLVGCVVFLRMALATVPTLMRASGVEMSLARPLLRLGGWMTVSNVVGPLMVNLDRFMVGMVLSMAAVAYYTTPYEVVSKLWVFVVALAGVLFPLFSSAYPADRKRVSELYHKGVRYLFLMLFPLSMLIVAFAHDALSVWMGPDFASHSTVVLQCLAIGVFWNSLAQVALALVQGAGRPDLAAKLHLAEVPFYLVALRVLIGAFGVVGAAAAWVTRVVLDGGVLFVLAARVVPEARQSLWRLLGSCAAAVGVLALAAFLPTPVARVMFVTSVLGAGGIAAWRWALTPEERTCLRRPFRRVERWLAE